MDFKRINKYLSNKATEEEVGELFDWIDASPQNKATFIKYKKAWAVWSKSYLDSDANWIQVRNTIRENDRKKRVASILKYAAIFVGILSIGYYFTIGNNSFENLNIQENAVTIQLENGDIEVISTDGTKQIIDKKGNLVGVQTGNEIVYSNTLNASSIDEEVNSNSERLAYNELETPFGKTFKVVLSDGTQVTLNSGSSLRYPVKFLKGNSRKVYLQGEANFEVSKDVDHPFIVNVNQMNVRVLGTQFNVSSYPEDSYYSTVLMEGSVAIYREGNTFSKETATLLEPGFRAKWNKLSEAVIVDKVNINHYTGWVSGKLVFKNMPFSKIRKKLERHYNVSIVNNNKILENKTYNAIFEKETIEEVMEILNKNFKIEYSLENNEIIIN